jgi:hypothetical protein
MNNFGFGIVFWGGLVVLVILLRLLIFLIQVRDDRKPTARAWGETKAPYRHWPTDEESDMERDRR